MDYANINKKLNFAQSAKATGKSQNASSAKASAAKNLQARSTINKNISLSMTPNVAARRSGLSSANYLRATYAQQRYDMNSGLFNYMPQYSAPIQPPQQETVVEHKQSFLETVLQTGLGIASMIFSSKTASAGNSNSSGGESNVDILQSSDLSDLSSEPADEAISQMNRADNSADKQTAITNANNQLQAMKNNEQKVASAQKKAKTQQTSVKKQLGDATTKCNAAQQQINTAKRAKQGAQDKKNAALKKMESDNNAFVNAKNQFDNAHEATFKAKSEVSNLEGQLSNTPKQIPDGKGGMKNNPAYADLKEKLQAAKNELKDAEAKEKEAKTTLDEQEKALKASEEQYAEQIEQLEQAEKQVEAAEKQMVSAQKELGKAQATQNELNRQLAELNIILEQCEQYSDKKAQLEKAIETAQRHLKDNSDDSTQEKS